MSVKIVTFGDSTTARREGVRVYADQLAEKFATGHPELRWVNKGVPGDSTMLAARRFEEDVLRENPQLVIIQFGLNDSAVDVWQTPPAIEPRVSKADYESNLRHFISGIQAQGGGVILMTPNQMRWTPKFRELYGKPPYRVEDEKGFTFFVEEYAEIVRRLASEYRAPLVDVYALYDLWEAENGKSCIELTLDGQHPNTSGHALVAGRLEPVIREALKF